MSSATAGARVIPLHERIRGCCVDLHDALPQHTADEIAALCRALADPTRVQMIDMLRSSAEPICVCDFTAAFNLGQPTVSHHLAKLRDAGLVTSFKRGVWAFYSLCDDMPTAARSAIDLVP